ncbi:MAG TPA: GTP cyclohydrolase I [Microbacterium sp.]|nr:GTP cyclohydrolase I [Microbacterium sp.]
MTAQVAQLHAVEDAPVTTRPPVDRPRALAAVAELIAALGYEVDADLAETPRRVVDGFVELTTPRPFAMTAFPNDDGYDEPVVVRDIPFVSLCRHHLLPFRGIATVGYLPGDKLIGLSKLARVVERHARDLQVQESLTVQIADTLEAELAPRGVGVVLRAEHMCMSLRGVQVAGATTETTTFRGELAGDRGLQARFREQI